MRRIGTSLLFFLVLFLSGCTPESEEPLASTRVLFVGNSISYYNGLPYLFSAIATDLYGEHVVVEFLMQPGGHLSDVMTNDKTITRLRQGNYDVVVLQEWGSQLLCGATEEERNSPQCMASLDAHRGLAEISGRDETQTILLGTYQPNVPVARALIVGEQWFVDSLGFDRYVSIAPIFLNGESQYPHLSWRAADGMHPGFDLSLAMALAVADAIFGSVPIKTPSLQPFETVQSPDRKLSYETVETDLSVFHTNLQTTVKSDVLASLRSLSLVLHN